MRMWWRTSAYGIISRPAKKNMQARELSDVTQRLRHMDALGIDVQVLYNGHGDTSSELKAISRFKAMEGLNPQGQTENSFR
jgi:hypothetical protein